MRKHWPLLVLTALTVGIVTSSAPVISAQRTLVTDSTPGKRDASAIAIVQKSLAALGGSDAIATVRFVMSSGTILKTGSSDPITFHWEDAVAGNYFQFRRVANIKGTDHVFASGHGRPGFGIVGSPAKRMGMHMSIGTVPLHLPAIVLYAELKNPAYGFKFIAANGNNPSHIEIINNSNSMMTAIVQQDWYFNPQTALPVRMDYNLPDIKNAFDTIRGSCTYSGYTLERGVEYPTSIEAFEQGKKISQVTISSIQPNAQINTADFDLPLETANRKGGSR